MEEDARTPCQEAGSSRQKTAIVAAIRLAKRIGYDGGMLLLLPLLVFAAIAYMPLMWPVIFVGYFRYTEKSPSTLAKIIFVCVEAILITVVVLEVNFLLHTDWP